MGLLSKITDFLFGWLVPDAPTPGDPGRELSKTATDAYLPKIYGSVKKHEGIIIFKATNDADNDKVKNDLLHIIVVWGTSVASIDEVYLDDVPISSSNDLFFREGVRIAHARNFPNGMGNYAAATLQDAGWTIQDNLDGVACTWIRLEYFPDSPSIKNEPRITADITGTLSANAISALQDYLTSSPQYGKNEPISRIDISAFSAATAVANTNVPLPNNPVATRQLFTANVAIDNSNSVLNNVNILLRASRCWLPVLNGKLTPIIERDVAPVSVEILERDIVELSGIKDSNKANRYNRVIVQYRDDSANATNQDAVWPEANSALDLQYLAEDNGVRLEASVDLPTCNNYYEALAHAKTVLDVSREALRANIELNNWATIFEVGDIVRITHSKPGWNQKPFRIERTTETDDRVTLSVREHQPNSYVLPGDVPQPIIPDTNLPQGPAIPTGLSVQLFLNQNRQGQFTWSSTAGRFDVQVFSVALVDVEVEPGVIQQQEQTTLITSERINVTTYSINGFDAGTFRFKVRAVGGLGLTSGFAALDFTLAAPAVPTAIDIQASNFALEVRPSLANADNSVQFEFQLTDPSVVDEPTVARGPASVFVFTGLSPNTEYKVWVRSASVLGVSDWVNQLATTTYNPSEGGGLLRQPFILKIPTALTAWSDAEATAGFEPYGGPVALDVATLVNESAGYVESRQWDGSAWVANVQVIDGNLAVDGTILARAINITDLYAQHANISGSLTVGTPSSYVRLLGAGRYIEVSKGGDTLFAVSENEDSFINGSALAPRSLLPGAISQDAISFIREQIGGLPLLGGGMVSGSFPMATGIFTLDPINSNGTSVTIDASYGGLSNTVSGTTAPTVPSLTLTWSRNGGAFAGNSQTFTGSVTEISAPVPAFGEPGIWLVTVPVINWTVTDIPGSGPVTYSLEITGANLPTLTGTLNVSANQATSGSSSSVWLSGDAVVVEEFSGTSLLIDVNNSGRHYILTSPTGCVVTVNEALVGGNPAPGRFVFFTQDTDAECSFVGATGVNIRSPLSNHMYTRYSTAMLTSRNATEWLLSGDLG